MTAILYNVAKDNVSLGRIILALSPTSPSSETVATIISQYPSASGIYYQPGTGLFPSMVFFMVGSQAVVCSYGVHNLVSSGAVALTAPALVPVNDLGHTGGEVLGLARRMIALATAAGASTRTPVLFAGHSLGGAGAETAAALWAAHVGLAGLSYVTFGAPKVGDFELAAAVNKVPGARVMNYGDPVPSLPPSPQLAPALYAAIPAVLGDGLREYQQPNLGTVVNGVSGKATRAIYAPTDYDLNEVSLLQGLVGNGGYFPPPHWMTNYIRAMTAVGWDVGAPPDLSTSPLKGQAYLTAAPGGPPKVTIVPALGGSTVATYIPPAFQMRAQRVGSMPKKYQVYWMGLLVTENATLSNAKTIARNGNRFLRRMLNDTTTVYGTSLGSALNLFLSAASSGTSGITPTLNVM